MVSTSVTARGDGAKPPQTIYDDLTGRGEGWIRMKGQYQISEDDIGPQGLPIFVIDRTVTKQEGRIVAQGRDLYDINRIYFRPRE